MAENLTLTKYLEEYGDTENTYNLQLDEEGTFTEPQGTHIVDALHEEVNIERDETTGDVTYTSKADDEDYVLSAYARTGNGDDVIMGSKGNDWINTDEGSDTVFGGEGHNMISTEEGDDFVVAGTIVSKKTSKAVEIVELSTEEEKVYAELAAESSEIYAGDGDDVVYGSNGNDFIWGQAGNDTIDLIGSGDKTVCIYGEEGDFQETIRNSRSGDTLQFRIGTDGYKFNDLTFNRDYDGEKNNDLRIVVDADVLADGEVFVKDFFAFSNALDRLYLVDGEGNKITKSIFADATINVTVSNGETYTPTDYYNENISVVGTATIAKISTKATIDFSDTEVAAVTYNRTDNDLIVVGEEKSVILKDYYKNPVAVNLNCEDDVVDLITIDSTDYTTVKVTSEWENLEFSRPNGVVDLVVTDKSTKTTYTYANYFLGLEEPFADFQTLEEEEYVHQNIKADATILVSGVSEFTGTDYTEEVTVSYGDALVSDVDTGAGNDVIYGGKKTDLLYGNEGDDYIYGGNGGIDYLRGAEGDDHIYAASYDSKTGKLTYNKTGVVIFGGEGDDYIEGGKGDDLIFGGAGNDTMTGNGGANFYKFDNVVEEEGVYDTITDATDKDTLEFENLVIDRSEDNETFNKVGDDLVITTIDEEHGNKENYVVIKNYFTTATKDRIDTFSVDGIEDSLANYVPIIIDGGNGVYKGSDHNETIVAEEYVSPNGKKGVTITTGRGDNTVLGSYFDDTITATKANLLSVTEFSGTNKISASNGDNYFELTSISYNTVTAGNGDNTVKVDTVGTNKITLGNGGNTVDLYSGTNTVKLGNAMVKEDGEWVELQNDVTISGGLNKVTTGKGVDSVTISAGENTLNLGNGANAVVIDDYATEEEIERAYKNTITTGKDADTFEIKDGTNTIKTGNGADVFTAISGGTNTITTGNGGKNEDGDKVGVVFEEISGGDNTIKTGSGADVFNISGEESVNDIKSNSGNDVFTIDAGVNTIDAGSGADYFEITGGTNTIKGGSGDDLFSIQAGEFNVIDGGAGKDTYDLSLYAGGPQVSIIDKSGSSEFVFEELKHVYFDISNIKEAKDGTAKSWKLGSTISYGSFDGEESSILCSLEGKNVYSVNKIKLVDEVGEVTISKSNIDQLASAVANWLVEEGYHSTAEAITAGSYGDLMDTFATYSDYYYTGQHEAGV